MSGRMVFMLIQQFFYLFFVHRKAKLKAAIQEASIKTIFENLLKPSIDREGLFVFQILCIQL